MLVSQFHALTLLARLIMQVQTDGPLAGVYSWNQMRSKSLLIP